MTNRELEAQYKTIADKTEMTDKEKTALLNRYMVMLGWAELGMSEEIITQEGIRVYGAIELLADMGRIRDDEDLSMLLNEIEAYARSIRDGVEPSPWDAGAKRRAQACAG